MKRFFFAIGIVLLLATGATAAQQAPANRAAAGAIEPNAVRDAGARVARMVDAGQLAQLWDEASGVTRKSVARDAFIAGINKSRQPLGAVTGRNWLSVHRQSGDGKVLPAGLYASSEFLAEFPGKPPVRELVSFRLDEDGIWRFAGYAVEP